MLKLLCSIRHYLSPAPFIDFLCSFIMLITHQKFSSVHEASVELGLMDGMKREEGKRKLLLILSVPASLKLRVPK